jgi:NAD(P)-dependent dehydrogenase (short-subunit alcohol dehydrogenase family)
MKTLDGKVVVITGAGSGIGRALALRAARHGAILAISDWDEVGLVETAQQAQTSTHHAVRTDKVDVRDRAAVAAYAASLREELGRINVIVNNAGVALHGDFEDTSYEDFEWVMDVDFWGVVHGTKEFLPHLIESGDGHVVNISSLFGLLSMPGQTAYNSAKFAVRGFTEALRHELAGRVGVTVVHPGGIKTNIVANARISGPDPGGEQAARARAFAEAALTMPPEEAAQLIVAAIQARKPRLVISRLAKAVDVVARLTPSRYWDVNRRLTRRRGMR